MATTQPTFFRRFEVFASFQSGKKSIRLEPVSISLGFTGSVDSDSGMIINLADIYQWIAVFTKNSAKKKYLNKWDFCLKARRDLKQIIQKSEHSDTRFSFHDGDVHFGPQNINLLWNQTTEIKSGKMIWLSPTTLTMSVVSSAWPPLSKSAEAKIKEQLKSVHVQTLPWKAKGLLFSSFEYIDPKLKITRKETRESV